MGQMILSSVLLGDDFRGPWAEDASAVVDAARLDVARTAVAELDRDFGEPDSIGIEMPIPGCVEPAVPWHEGAEEDPPASRADERARLSDYSVVAQENPEHFAVGRPARPATRADLKNRLRSARCVRGAAVDGPSDDRHRDHQWCK